MKLRILFPILFLIVFYIGCATGYHKSGFTGGFDETQLSKNVWKINFSGNAFTRQIRTQDYLMLRNAELTKENGYKYFSVIKEKSEIQTSIYSSSPTSTTFGNYGNGSFYSTTQQSGGGITTLEKPSSENTIIMLNEKPNNSSIIYDPEFLINSIKGKYPEEFGDK